jgi:tetratricopeptide (TPR) repeat protein
MTAISQALKLAVKHVNTGHLRQAENLCRQILYTDANHDEALHLLGLISHKTGKYDVAVDLIRKAIDYNPRSAEYHYNLGVILAASGMTEDALKAYQDSLRLKPDYGDALNNLGLILYERGKIDESVILFEQAVGCNPDLTNAYYNLGKALQALGKPGDAIRAYDQVLKLLPDSAETRFNRSLSLLLLGKFEEGWKQYEWRFRGVDKPSTSSAKWQPHRWDGSRFTGQRLLVVDEQGIGDTFQFIRYLPMVKQRGGMVGFETIKPLIDLFKNLKGIDELWHRASFPTKTSKFDLFVPLMSLPGNFNTVLKTIPADVPYIYPDATKVRHWEKRLQKGPFKVGIVWAGKASDAYRQNRLPGLDHVSLEWTGQPASRFANDRSTCLMDFLPLTKIPGIQLYGLQKGAAEKQVKEFSHRIDLISLGEELDDFGDTAAVIANMDLVISVDTAVAHLAGAMAKPVWILIPFVADWRWLLDRDDSPWYPTARLFRQKAPNDWGPVLQRVGNELHTLVHQKGIK